MHRKCNENHDCISLNENEMDLPTAGLPRGPFDGICLLDVRVEDDGRGFIGIFYEMVV